MESGVFDNLELIGIRGSPAAHVWGLESLQQPTLDVAKGNLYSRTAPESAATFVILSTLPDNFRLDNGFAR
jgi:hypothetical protein